VFEWKQYYETGVSFIDDHHKRLFELAGENINKSKNNETSINNREFFNELLDFIKFNFAIEEDYMSEVEYVEFNRHKEEHSIFITRLCYLNSEEFDEEENYEKIYWEKVFHFIYSWLHHHMVSEDSKYNSFEDAI
jgi:hemerythrin